MSYGSLSLNAKSDITNQNIPRLGTRITIPDDWNVDKNACPRTIRYRSSVIIHHRQTALKIKDDTRLGDHVTQSATNNSHHTHMFTSPNYVMPNPKSARK